jgi:hypothetical protein
LRHSRRVERAHRFILVAAFDDVFATDGDGVDFDARDGSRAFGDRFSEFGRMTAAGMINDRNSAHSFGGSLIWVR